MDAEFIHVKSLISPFSFLGYAGFFTFLRSFLDLLRVVKIRSRHFQESARGQRVFFYQTQLILLLSFYIHAYGFVGVNTFRGPLYFLSLLLLLVAS